MIYFHCLLSGWDIVLLFLFPRSSQGYDPTLRGKRNISQQVALLRLSICTHWKIAQRPRWGRNKGWILLGDKSPWISHNFTHFCTHRGSFCSRLSSNSKEPWKIDSSSLWRKWQVCLLSCIKRGNISPGTEVGGGLFAAHCERFSFLILGAKLMEINPE